MLVLGISDLEHDPAVALIDDHRPVAAIEESKLNRSSRSTRFPQLAVEYCLREAGVKMADVALSAAAGRANRASVREARLCSQFPIANGGQISGRALGRSSRDLGRLSALERHLDLQRPLETFEHHLCHAASAFYPSEFDRALVLTLDQCGDMWAGLLAVGEGTKLRTLKPLRFPNSMGLVYTDITGRIGFQRQRDEHKTLWLSTQGEPDFLTNFRTLFSVSDEGLPELNQEHLRHELGGGWHLSDDFYKTLELMDRRPPEQALLAAVARSAQEYLEETVVALAETFRLRTGASHLCLAGGVFLNVLLVRALEERTGFSRIFVQPAAGNPGTALGAAYLARARANGQNGREALSNLFLGPSFDSIAIKAVLDNCKVVYDCQPVETRLLSDTVGLLQDGKIVAWHQGRMEFGLRALGNRSILASPFSRYVKENLNEYIKHREDFHPFILAVPAEVAPRYFEFSGNCRFVTSVGLVRPEIHDFDRFVFDGRRVRLHVVEQETNPRFWNLLHAFGQSAPAPVLVNTSFNLFGESLVCAPRDAIRTFYCSGIDALVIGDFLIVK
jgi:carbamoyltransferase